jgi:DNA-binding GntR family transcriptional regulator
MMNAAASVSNAPLHAQISTDLRRRIEAGEWAPGEKIHSTERLRQHYARRLRAPRLAASTVRRAITEMLLSGELRGRSGAGVYVAERRRQKRRQD